MSIQRLLDIMARLRDPASGCPWDREQTFASIAPYTIEEAYEVADAIEREDLPALRDELGDLLFQVVFHARLAQEQGAFEFADVANAISEKLERRHPHVFAGARIDDAEAQSRAWEDHKRRERAARHASVLDDVPHTLPALTRANKLGKRVAQVGFEWADVHGAVTKLEEELHELQDTLAQPDDRRAIEDELGDVLFCVVNVCRYLHIDPEHALRQTNRKFENRFRYIEAKLAEHGRTPEQSTLEEMDRLWDEAKLQMKGS